MQNYQFDTNSDPDKVLETNVRPLTDEDLDRWEESRASGGEGGGGIARKGGKETYFIWCCV